MALPVLLSIITLVCESGVQDNMMYKKAFFTVTW